MHILRTALRLVLVWMLLAFPLPTAAADGKGATLTVNTNADGGDAAVTDGICDADSVTSGEQCTLRAAIQTANYLSGPNQIVFSGAMTISPNTNLPPFSTTFGNTIALDGALQVTLDGSGVPTTTTSIGLQLAGDSSTVQGLTIRDFNYGILVEGNLNMIGVDDADGSAVGEQMVIISNASSSMDAEAGIYITGDYNMVSGCLVGLTQADAADANEYGIYIMYGSNNIIGTDGDGALDDKERNWISGNEADGISIRSGANGNTIAGNYIGVNALATSERPNGGFGIYVYVADDQVIGTNGDGVSDALEGNVISGNDKPGIYLVSSTDNLVAGNHIGTDKNGTTAIPNTVGVHLQGVTGSVIGTNGDGVSDALEANWIGGNTSEGIYLQYSESNWIAGNFIGLDSDQVSALPNAFNGIKLDASSDNLIGSDANGISDALERNVIGGNGQKGITVDCNSSGGGNEIAGNYIGTRPSGDVALPNTNEGIFIEDCLNGGTIGGPLPGQRNVISGNLGGGILLNHTSQYLIQNNWVGKGTDAYDAPLGNGGTAGIYIKRYTSGLDSNNNWVSGNVVAHNSGIGIKVGQDNSSDFSSGNRLDFNTIYDNGGLGIDLGAAGASGIDAFDSDSGPNGLQNYPDLTGASYSGIVFNINVYFHSAASQTYTLSFYRSSACDSSGYGEGKDLIGTSTVTTAANGDIYLIKSLAWPVIAHNEYITALATGPDGSTSEFSACRQFTGTPPVVYPVFLPGILR